MTHASGIRVDLPTFDRTRPYRSLELSEPGPWTRPSRPITSRVASAAAHVVPAAGADPTPGAPVELDWDVTLALRHRIWEYGLGVAEAMDTAQRGMGLDRKVTEQLIRRSCAEARSVGGRIVCGAGTDDVDPDAVPDGQAGLRAVVDAYREGVALVQEAGGRDGDPHLDPGPRPAPLRRAQAVLQDRDRLPLLARRDPARVRHGGRPAVRPLDPPPDRARGARRRRRAAARPARRGSAGAQPARGAGRGPVTGRTPRWWCAHRVRTGP